MSSHYQTQIVAAPPNVRLVAFEKINQGSLFMYQDRMHLRCAPQATTAGLVLNAVRVGPAIEDGGMYACMNVHDMVLPVLSMEYRTE